MTYLNTSFQRDTSSPVIKKITRTHTQRYFYKSIIPSASRANTKIIIKVFFRGKTTNVKQQSTVANTCYILSDNIYCCFNSFGGGKKKMKITDVLHFWAHVMCNRFRDILIGNKFKSLLNKDNMLFESENE